MEIGETGGALNPEDMAARSRDNGIAGLLYEGGYPLEGAMRQRTAPKRRMQKWKCGKADIARDGVESGRRLVDEGDARPARLRDAKCLCARDSKEQRGVRLCGVRVLPDDEVNWVKLTQSLEQPLALSPRPGRINDDL